MMLLILLIAFLIAASPMTYRATRGVFGAWVATQEGAARTGGLLLHAVVFIALVMALKRLKRSVSKYDHWSDMDTHGADEVGGLSTKSQEGPHTLEPAAYSA